MMNRIAPLLPLRPLIGLLLLVPLISQARPASATAASIGQSGSAQSLVNKLRSAKTDAKRVQAMDSIFGAIGLAVSDAHLHAVVRAEKNASNIYLYTDEVQEMATAYGKGKLVSFEDLAGTLSGSGLVAKASPNSWTPPTLLTGEQIRNDIRSGVQHSLHRTGPSGLYVQILRDLGLRRKTDLAKTVPYNAEVLDPVQQLLIMLIFDADAKQDLPSGGNSPKAISILTDNALKYSPSVRTSGSPCGSGPWGSAISALAAARSVVAQLGDSAPWATSVLFTPADLFHADALGLFIELKPISKDLVTGEFGQTGRYSADPMDFEVEAWNDGYPSDSLVKCGALAGYTFPKHGAVPGMEMDYSTTGFKVTGDTIEDFGQAATDYNIKTNKHGLAHFMFQPDDEYLPNTGPVRSANGFIHVSAMTLKSTGNGFSWLNGLGVTPGLSLGWGITWHQAKGYQISIPSFKVKESWSDSSETWKLKLNNMATCLGDDGDGQITNALPHPLDAKETEEVPEYPAFGAGSKQFSADNGYVTGTGLYHGPEGSGTTNVYVKNVTMPINNDGPISIRLTGGTDLSAAQVRDTVSLAGGHAVSTVTISFNKAEIPNGTTISPMTQTFRAPWTEATSCPMPKPVH